MTKRGNIVAAMVVALLSFITVAWYSCTKTKQQYVRCEGVVCQNGGYCSMDTVTKTPKCICPTGYEGSDCGIASAVKFFGSWDMHQRIDGSDSVIKDTNSYYMVTLEQTATPTTFFINNFFNDPYYNYITCTLDSMDSKHFIIDSLSTFHMMYDHYSITNDSLGNISYGYINPTNDTIAAHFVIRFKNKSTNWQRDTISFWLTRHHY
jgi:hypothetical protein